jgi:hypothetical protein
MFRPVGFRSPKPEIFRKDIMRVELESDIPDIWRIEIGPL